MKKEQIKDLIEKWNQIGEKPSELQKKSEKAPEE